MTLRPEFALGHSEYNPFLFSVVDDQEGEFPPHGPDRSDATGLRSLARSRPVVGYCRGKPRPGAGRGDCELPGKARGEDQADGDGRAARGSWCKRAVCQSCRLCRPLRVCATNVRRSVVWVKRRAGRGLRCCCSGLGLPSRCTWSRRTGKATTISSRRDGRPTCRSSSSSGRSIGRAIERSPQRSRPRGGNGCRLPPFIACQSITSNSPRRAACRAYGGEIAPRGSKRNGADIQ